MRQHKPMRKKCFKQGLTIQPLYSIIKKKGENKMTVKELIKLLEKCDPCKEIYVAHDEEDGEEILKVDDSLENATFIIYKKRF